MRKAFTLIEVNLAMVIMAGGVLSLVGLYALGFRENGQSREDVAATALADSVVSPLVMALSATNVKWTAFNSLKNYPSDNGWGDYFNHTTGLVTQDPESMAETVFGNVISRLSLQGNYGSITFPSTALDNTGMRCGLVVTHEDGSAVVKIAFRAVRESKVGLLLAMPLFYTEVRFQGVSDQ